MWGCFFPGSYEVFEKVYSVAESCDLKTNLLDKSSDLLYRKTLEYTGQNLCLSEFQMHCGNRSYSGREQTLGDRDEIFASPRSAGDISCFERLSAFRGIKGPQRTDMIIWSCVGCSSNRTCVPWDSWDLVVLWLRFAWCFMSVCSRLLTRFVVTGHPEVFLQVCYLGTHTEPIGF